MASYVFDKSDGSINFDGTKIYIDVGDNVERLRENDDVLLMHKSPPYIDVYKALGTRLNILELGILRGGSTPFIHRLLEPRKLVCIDLCAPVPALDRYVADHGNGIIAPYYHVDQGDKNALADIIEKEFDGPIDLIVDDASHFYRESKASFEAVFPFLKTGGTFLLEDWSWSHGPGADQPDHYAYDRGALTSLLFELIAAMGTHAPLFIEEMYILHCLARFRKGQIQLPKRGFLLDNYMQLRGKSMLPL
jgi:SAM-dependent methyltransferase